MPTSATLFLDTAQHYLEDEYLPKIERCLQQLSDEDVWWRPNEASNSIGHLLLHLEGNLRQWVVSGVGGAEDVRTRTAEFGAEPGSVSPDLLLEALRRAVHEAVEVIRVLPVTRLTEACRIQGYTLTVQEALFHAVEHFSTHTGQILYITKARTGNDLAFYQGDGDRMFPAW